MPLTTLTRHCHEHRNPSHIAVSAELPCALEIPQTLSATQTQGSDRHAPQDLGLRASATAAWGSWKGNLGQKHTRPVRHTFAYFYGSYSCTQRGKTPHFFIRPTLADAHGFWSWFQVGNLPRRFFLPLPQHTIGAYLRFVHFEDVAAELLCSDGHDLVQLVGDHRRRERASVRRVVDAHQLIQRPPYRAECQRALSKQQGLGHTQDLASRAESGVRVYPSQSCGAASARCGAARRRAGSSVEVLDYTKRAGYKVLTLGRSTCRTAKRASGSAAPAALLFCAPRARHPAHLGCVSLITNTACPITCI